MSPVCQYLGGHYHYNGPCNTIQLYTVAGMGEGYLPQLYPGTGISHAHSIMRIAPSVRGSARREKQIPAKATASQRWAATTPRPLFFNKAIAPTTRESCCQPIRELRLQGARQPSARPQRPFQERRETKLFRVPARDDSVRDDV